MRMNPKLMTILVPVGLILLIIGITGIASALSKRNEGKSEEEIGQWQQSIPDDGEDPIHTDGEKSGPTAAPVPGDRQKPSEKPISSGTPAPTALPTTPPAKSAAPEKLYQNVKFRQKEQLAEMMGYWADNNQKALDDLAFLEHYKAMSYSLLGTDHYYYYGEENAAGKPEGTGIAVYGDNKYYYGSWSNGKRSGKGTFLHYHIHEEAGSKDRYSFHFYVGGWKEDLPEGTGSEHYEYHQHLLQENTGYNTNLFGAYQAGLYHGEFYITNLYSDGNIKEWDAAAKNGVFDYQSKNKDTKGRRTVQVDRADLDNYIWMHPGDNKNQGVLCMNVSGERIR